MHAGAASRRLTRVRRAAVGTADARGALRILRHGLEARQAHEGRRGPLPAPLMQLLHPARTAGRSALAASCSTPLRCWLSSCTAPGARSASLAGAGQAVPDTRRQSCSGLQRLQRVGQCRAVSHGPRPLRRCRDCPACRTLGTGTHSDQGALPGTTDLPLAASRMRQCSGSLAILAPLQRQKAPASARLTQAGCPAASRQPWVPRMPCTQARPSCAQRRVEGGGLRMQSCVSGCAQQQVGRVLGCNGTSLEACRPDPRAYGAPGPAVCACHGCCPPSLSHAGPQAHLDSPGGRAAPALAMEQLVLAVLPPRRAGVAVRVGHKGQVGRHRDRLGRHAEGRHVLGRLHAPRCSGELTWAACRLGLACAELAGWAPGEVDAVRPCRQAAQAGGRL